MLILWASLMDQSHEPVYGIRICREPVNIFFHVQVVDKTIYGISMLRLELPVPILYSFVMSF